MTYDRTTPPKKKKNDVVSIYPAKSAPLLKDGQGLVEFPCLSREKKKHKGKKISTIFLV